jgi:mannose-6-phosphate isomerase-like protein (cupin superfamily)
MQFQRTTRKANGIVTHNKLDVELLLITKGYKTMAGKEKWNFVHSVATEAEWKPGLRKIFDYRDLSIKDGTGGDFVAHVIRRNGTKGSDGVQSWHVHDCQFQMIYVLNGWATFEYDGQGERTIQKGDAVLQVSMIKHREIACSDDFEVLEIVSPGDFVTELVKPPV